MKSLVIGLGNKGPNYKNHRHNVGSEIVSKICEIMGRNVDSVNKVIENIVENKVNIRLHHQNN